MSDQRRKWAQNSSYPENSSHPVDSTTYFKRFRNIRGIFEILVSKPLCLTVLFR